MKKHIEIYPTVKQICIILDALEFFEENAPDVVKDEIGDMRTGLSIALPMEFQYPEDEQKREKLNADLTAAKPGRRWVNRFIAYNNVGI